jgi:hypothetical protein
MEEEDRKETADEANRRRTNHGNGLMVRKKVGMNKGVTDGYVAWPQDKIQKTTKAAMIVPVVSVNIWTYK